MKETIMTEYRRSVHSKCGAGFLIIRVTLTFRVNYGVKLDSRARG